MTAVIALKYLSKGRLYNSRKTPSNKTQRAPSLVFGTDAHAFAAEDASVGSQFHKRPPHVGRGESHD